jgi:amino acid transporter
LYSDASTLDDLSTAGRWVALAILAVFVVVNALGAAFFARTNTLITWFKLLIPLLVAVSLIAMHFEPGNFTAAGGFAPDGVHGILSAISAGGIIYAYLGFRHAIDMSGEVRRPQVTIPLALTLIIVICALVYLLLQVSFIGALSAEDLEHGWTGLAFGHHLGPIAGVVLGLGLTWLTVSLYAGAILGPVGSALVATGSNARLTKVLADVNLFSPVFARLSSRAVPLNAMLLNLAVGAAVVLWVPFEEAVTLNSASITLSLAAGPLAVYSLRLQLPDAKRRFRLPAVRLMALAGFTLVTLIIYWSGWETTWRLGLALLTGAALVFVRHALSRNGLSALELRGAAWLLPYGVGLGLLSYLGDFSGGLRLIPFGWDLLAGVVLSLAIFPYALHCRLDPERTRRYAAEATAEAGR